MPKPLQQETSSVWKLRPYISPQLSIIARALVCTAIFTVFWPILAWLAGEMAQYIGEGDVGSLTQLAAVAAVFFLLRGLAQFGQDAFMARAALKIAFNLRTSVYAHLQTLSLDYFETAKTGDLSYRLTEDSDRIGEAINKFFHDFIPCVLQIIAVVGYMIYLNWQLTVSVIVIAPLMGLLIGGFGERLLQLSRRAQSKISNLAALLTEVFGGMRLIQAFTAEAYEIERFNHEARQNQDAQYRTAQLKALQFVVVGFLEAMSVVLLFCLAGWQIGRGNLTGAEFVSYGVAVAMLIDPIGHITENYNHFKQSEASCDRVFELLALKPDITEPQDALELKQVQGKVEFQSISFAYKPDVPVLKNINLRIHPGETVALVGSSGAGKTTLINLIPRFIDPQVGQILIDGTDIQQVTLHSLRSLISIVPQDTLLFSGTIAENIAFGQLNPPLPQIEAAALTANAHEFISKLPQGYYSYLGERGAQLSGGQKQRIAIARAIFSDPEILILDEATSALDVESEALVQAALENIVTNRTVFIIAHRLATVQKADRIVVMEAGQILEMGTHEQLLAQNGRYAQFHSRQLVK